MSDGAEVRSAGRLFQRLVAETGNARLPRGCKMELSVSRRWMIGVSIETARRRLAYKNWDQK